MPIGPVNEFREESDKDAFAGPWQAATTEVEVNRFAGPWQVVVAEILPDHAAGPWQTATAEAETDKFGGPWQADLYQAEVPTMADLTPVGYDKSTGTTRPQTDGDEMVTEEGGSSQARSRILSPTSISSAGPSSSSDTKSNPSTTAPLQRTRAPTPCTPNCKTRSKHTGRTYSSS